MEQNNINKRSGRKCQDFDEAEKAYQEAQKEWEEDENNVKAWQSMFTLMNTAIFNICNKKLELILEKEEIEGRALDITCVVMNGIKKKRKDQPKWDEDKELITKEITGLDFYKHLSTKRKKDIINAVIELAIGERPEWKITTKVSSYAYLPCLALYRKQLQFEDGILGQDAYEPDESNMDDDNFYSVKTNWEYKEGYGYYE